MGEERHTMSDKDVAQTDAQSSCCSSTSTERCNCSDQDQHQTWMALCLATAVRFIGIFVLNVVLWAHSTFQLLLPVNERSPDDARFKHGLDSRPAHLQTHPGSKSLLIHGLLVNPLSLAPADDVICAPISSTASSHDKACELFAYLKGGLTDYGQQHARMHGHSQYGPRWLEAAHPAWGPECPLHVVGHSAGGITALLFADMVASGAFEYAGHRTTSKWIASVTCVQAPLGGTPTTEYFSARYHEHGTELPAWTVAHLLSAAVHLYDKLAPDCLKALFDTRSPYTAQTSQLTVAGCCKPDGWLCSSDCALWELSPNCAQQLLAPLKLHPEISYFSVATCCTVRDEDGRTRVPAGTFLPLRHTCDYLLNTCKVSRHDGLVPLAAQRAPPGHEWSRWVWGQKPVRGVWNVMQMRGDHFAFYMSSPAGYKLLELAQSFRLVAENHPVDCVQDCAFEERLEHFGACVDDSEYDSAMSE